MTHKFSITHHSGEELLVEAIESNGMEVRATQQGAGNYLIEYKMNNSLESSLRKVLDELEGLGIYEISTDTVRGWLDIHNEVEEKAALLGSADEEYLGKELSKHDNIKVIIK